MVRKKVKKAYGAAKHDESSLADPSALVFSWLKDLKLLERDRIPEIDPDLDIFSLLEGPPLMSLKSLSSVHGVRSLRAAIMASSNIDLASLSFLFLAAMVIYIDSNAHELRKSIKGLMLEIERVLGRRTEDIAELVVAKFVELAWSIGERCCASSSRESTLAALRIAASLQWLVDIPSAGRVLVTNSGGVQLGRCVACLGLMIEAQATPLKRWRDDDRANKSSATESVCNSTLAVTSVRAEMEANTGGVQETKYDLSVAVNFCGEIMKTASSLISISKNLDVRQLPGGDARAKSICEVCLQLLSCTAAHREVATHGSTVLIHLAIASWRARGRWARGINTSVAEGAECNADRGFSKQLNLAASMIVKSVFPGHASEQPPSDVMCKLLRSYMPLPPSSALALCRALMHIVSPHVLLAKYGSDCVSVDNLFTGPILQVILSNAGADKGLQLRFLSLQVLDAWCGKAKSFWESGLLVQDPAEGHHEKQPELCQSLSNITDSAVAALVHPVRFISSIAPALLEHVVNLQHLVRTSGCGVDGHDFREWDYLVGRVLEQSASNKGKYVALVVLLPRVGALRLMRLCPSLVEQVVWAVGIRGNVSGQAASLLLELVDALKKEIEAKRDKAAMLEDDVMKVCRAYWVGPAAAAVTQEDAWSSSHVAAYLLPEMFKFDPGSAAALCSELRIRGRLHASSSPRKILLSSLNDIEENTDPQVRQMWAIMEIVRLARKSGTVTELAVVGGKNNADSRGLLQLHEVEWAALHVDETLRMSALSLLCTDARVTTVPVAAEIDLLRKVLPYSLKVFGAQNRQILLRAVQVDISLLAISINGGSSSVRQTLMARMRETVRVCSKHLSAARSDVKGSDASNEGKYKGRGSNSKPKEDDRRVGCERDKVKDKVKGAVQAGEEGESPDRIVERVQHFARWLCQAISESLYPGCPFEREVFGLEVIQLVLSELQPGESSSAKQGINSIFEVVSSSLFCRPWVDTLLALLGSSWERSRALSYAILSRFPRPLPGYDCQDQDGDGAARLASEGLRLAGSGRQRDSDRGALVLRLLFVVYARDLGLEVPLSVLEAEQRERANKTMIVVEGEATRGTGGRGAVGAVGGDATARFLDELCLVISLRLDGMERSFNTLFRREMDATVDTASSDKEITSLPHGLPHGLGHGLPHGLFLAAHHVLIDSRLEGGTAAGGRKQRHSKPRSAVSTGDVANNAVDLHRRREMVSCLQKHAFRALRLSHLVVGGDGQDGGGLDKGSTMSHGGTKEGEPETGSVACGLNHSVNANGHMGMVSVDSFGRAVPPPVRRGRSGGTGAGKPGGAEPGFPVTGFRVQDSNGTESQRAIVGAWLLAKETCRCLSTIVTAFPLPSGDGKAGKGGTERVESKSLLTVKDITVAGETLLRSMLSFKHMGCVVSAQAAFQAVCESLLHGAGHDPSLSQLPSVWLDKLLRHLDGTGQEFMLRRSAGLASAFMSIFRAEPRSVSPVLLPRGMDRLLALADTEERIEEHSSATGREQLTCSEGEWKVVVTALNVLRQAFIDAPLADDIGPYVTQAIIKAVRGFEHSTWAVRNSSMMLFASIMQRAVGGAKNAGNIHSQGARRPHSPKPAVTAEAFFEQHKQLHPFLLSQLETAANHTVKASDDLTEEPKSGEAGAGGAEMHPALYPILLLLAKLRSAGAEATVIQMEASVSRSARPTAALVPAVIRCARNPNFLARAASARALAALVPPSESPALIRDLVGGLPKSAIELASGGAGTHNFTHGTLLQVLELLQAARAVHSDPRISDSSVMLDHQESKESKDEKEGKEGKDEKDEKDECKAETNDAPGVTHRSSDDIAITILDRVWLADPETSRCPPVRHVMLRLLKTLYDSREYLHENIVRDRVLSSLRSAEELNLTDATGNGSSRQRFVPGGSLLVLAVVDSSIRRRLDETLTTQKRGVDVAPGVEKESERDGRVAFVVDLLCHSDVDVRDAAIKSTKKFFGDNGGARKASRVDQGALRQLLAGAAKALAAEGHPPNVRRLVRLLCRIGLRLDVHREPVPVEPLWCHLRNMCDGATPVTSDVRAGALEAMGTIVRLGNESSRTSRLREYVGLLEGANDPEQPMLTTIAAAASLSASGVLSYSVLSDEIGHRCWGSNKALAAIHARLLFVALMLLQDDDQRVRACVSRTCAGAADGPPAARDCVQTDVRPMKGGGGRVDLLATELVLTRLTVLSESETDADGSVAKQFSLDLIRAIEAISSANVEGLLAALSPNAGGDEETTDTCRGWGGHEDDCGADKVWEDGTGGHIFDREERKQFHEPVLFACAAGPYLKRTLHAMKKRGDEVPRAVSLGFARVLEGLSKSLKALTDSPRTAARVTWVPEVYQGIVAASAAAVGAAALGSAIKDREGGWSKEATRVLGVCKKLDEVLGGDEGLHPGVLNAVQKVMSVSQ